MKTPKTVNTINQIEDDLVTETVAHKKQNTKRWIKWAIPAACFCALILCAHIWKPVDTPQIEYVGEQPFGFDEVYPTVMVDGKLYEWRKGMAIYDTLPETCVYYGQVKCVGRNSPEGDCEFTAAFMAEGDIYKCQEDECVYICLTTDWLEDTVVAFDLLRTK